MVSLGKPRRHGLRMAMLNLTQGDWATRRREVSPRFFFLWQNVKMEALMGTSSINEIKAYWTSLNPMGFPCWKGFFGLPRIFGLWHHPWINVIYRWFERPIAFYVTSGWFWGPSDWNTPESLGPIISDAGQFIRKNSVPIRPTVEDSNFLNKDDRMNIFGGFLSPKSSSSWGGRSCWRSHTRRACLTGRVFSGAVGRSWNVLGLTKRF